MSNKDVKSELQGIIIDCHDVMERVKKDINEHESNIWSATNNSQVDYLSKRIENLKGELAAYSNIKFKLEMFEKILEKSID